MADKSKPTIKEHYKELLQVSERKIVQLRHERDTYLFLIYASISFGVFVFASMHYHEVRRFITRLLQ
jgi:hypothetical protein